MSKKNFLEKLAKAKREQSNPEREAMVSARADEASNQTVAVNKTEESEQNYEGQLTLDVYQTSDNIVIKSTIAGVKAEDLDVTINNDMITIKGTRRNEDKMKSEDYYYQECYLGSFSRSVILPIDIEVDQVKADLKDGILTISLPKANKVKAHTVRVEAK